MTITTTDRLAGPFRGDNETTEWPFDFVVYDKSHLRVVLARDGQEYELIADSDYEIELNDDQQDNPGGFIRYPHPDMDPPGFPLTHQETLAITTVAPAVQTASFRSAGGFRPQTVEQRLDYLTVLVQQLMERMARVPEAGISDEHVNMYLGTAVQRADRFLAFDGQGNPLFVNATSADPSLQDEFERIKESMEQLEELVEQLAPLAEEVPELRSELDALQVSVGALQASVASLASRMTSAENDISALQSEVSNLVFEVAQIDAAVGSLSSSVSSLQSTVSSLSSSVSSLQSTVSSLSSSVSSLQSSVGTLQNDVSNLQGRMTSAENDISGLQGRMDSAESDISALESDVSDLAGPRYIVSNSSRTLELADAGHTLHSGAGNSPTLTIPPNSSVPFPIGTRIKLLRTGTGTTTVASGSGVSLYTREGGDTPVGSVTIPGNSSVRTCYLVKFATDLWALEDYLTPADLLSGAEYRRQAISSNDQPTEPQEFLSFVWEEGNQNLGVGEGIRLAMKANMVSGPAPGVDFEFGNIQFRKGSANDSSMYMHYAVQLTPDSNGSPPRDVLMIDGFTGEVIVDSLTEASDVRLKSDLRVIEGALDKVRQLTGYTFSTANGVRSAGVIAQDVQRVLPEAVVERQDGMLTVGYGRLLGLLVEAIKELADRR